MKPDKRKLELLVNAAINSKFEPAVGIEAAILTYHEEMIEPEIVPLLARIAELERVRKEAEKADYLLASKCLPEMIPLRSALIDCIHIDEPL